jgi:DNA-binding HxlR family transcriptional regulator
MALRVRKNRVSVPPEAMASRQQVVGALPCPLNRCMDLLKGAWAPQVVWYLSAQPRRFGELRLDLPRISARVLSARLRELEAEGVVARHAVAGAPPSTEYALTPLGLELVPAIAALVEVGRKLKRSPSAAAL